MPLSREGRASVKAMRRAWVDGLDGRIRRHMREVVSTSGDELVDMQKRLVPVDTGDLRDSIVNVVDTQALKATVSAGDRRVYWAGWAEFGTFKTPAQPFFWPSWRAKKPEFKRRFAAAFRKLFKNYGAPAP